VRYLCLGYLKPHVLERMTDEERKVLDRDCRAHRDALRRSGHFIHAEALQPADQAVMIRVRDGKMSSTDGPFAETKEHLGGFILIEAADMEEAVRIAAGAPAVKLCAIEVRPIYDIPDPHVRIPEMIGLGMSGLSG
jgi:hypothetical protein